MPANPNLPKWDYLGTLHKGEPPATKIMDEISALKVTLVSKPDDYQLYKLFRNVADVSWDKPWDEDMSYENAVEFLSTLIGGGMLPLGLEMNNFTFLIENVTRITTHALVRGRVGMTYAQQSTGNADQRHCDILIPRSFSTQNDKLKYNFTQFVKLSKMYYSDAVDKGMSVQEARCFLPTANANKLYISMNLASLMNFFGKRSDRTEEYMQGNEVCRQIKAIFDKNYPELSPVLRSTCGKSCAHSKNSPFVNGVYLPSTQDDVFDWNPKSFLYQQTRDEMCWNETPNPNIYIVGDRYVDQTEYELAHCTKIHE